MTAVEWFIEQLEEKGSASENVSIRRLEISIDVSEYLDLKRKVKEIEKQREKSIFSIAYRMMPTEYGKEHCEAEFEKFIQPNL